MLTPEVAADVVAECMHLVMLIVSVIVLPGLLVGLLVALLQAATQINEQTLSFLPRLLVTLFVMGLAGNWMFSALMDFCVSVFERAGTLVH